MGPKVYVTLGFHVNFYHSWRGDTPDEAGFGTDMRVVRRILDILNEANAKGLQARGYWDTEVYWTFENILPPHAPDIIEGIRRRVHAGQDEILPGPYNNGANHAATAEEFRAAIELALENPRGSGLKQLFGRTAPFYRPQESMQTAGQNKILLDHGFQGIVHYYAGVPFNTLSTFIPALPPKRQYNPLWMKCAPDEPPIILLPCISMGDILNHISLEMWLLELHRLQASGRVDTDLLLHINFDADGESWLPFNLPKVLSWFPNSGGLVEYIQAVNKYPWAEFTLPSEYIQNHPPQAEIHVRQDLADGAFDGSTSWAEKFPSLQLWSTLERSRLHTYRAQALAKHTAPELRDEIQQRLWEGVDSSFFQRLIGLSTTHFGMSTPVINEERQANAESILEKAFGLAIKSERQAALHIRERLPMEAGVDYAFEVYNYSRGRDQAPVPAKMAVRVPVILPSGVERLVVKDPIGDPVRASLINIERLPDRRLCGEIAFVEQLGPDEQKSYQVLFKGNSSQMPVLASLHNRWIEVEFSKDAHLKSIRYLGREIAGEDFLEPFITYRSGRRTKKWQAGSYASEGLGGEQWEGLNRVRVNTSIPMETPDGEVSSQLRFTFTLFDELPYLFVDVQAIYAYITPRDVMHNIQQKLRRLIDLNWIEVAPLQIHPTITAPAENPLRIWKHNYLGITSCYDLNYGDINPKNKNLDAFNHQVTAGWVAVSNGEQGLLLAENAEELTSMSFCPMRLREVEGMQHLYLNPFGTYYGKQLDYAHVGGNGVGAAITGAVSNALNSSAPSFNGKSVHFSIMLAPYAGDAPPQEVQDEAAAFFYPFGILYTKTPPEVDTMIPEDVQEQIKTLKKSGALSNTAPLPAPMAFLVNPSDQGASLVWDAPRDARLSGYELRWKEEGDPDWQTNEISLCSRWTINGLENGKRYAFQMRSLAGDNKSSWSETAHCSPGPIQEVEVTGTASAIPLWTMLKMAAYGLVHGVVTRWIHRKV